MKVHAIPGTGFASNAFVVVGDGGCAIADAGWESDAREVIAGADKALGKRKVDRLVLTHMHIDHVGGAAAIAKKYGCEILVHGEDAGPLLKGDKVATGAVFFGGDIEPMKVKKLSEGDRVLGFEVLHTPGHTMGSICLYDKEARALISGDTVFRDGVGRWDLPSGDLRELLVSVRRLAKLDVEGLYPGHGPSVPSGGSAHIMEDLDYLEAFGGM
jgi:hydroxyacylglutathione hydrolase